MKAFNLAFTLVCEECGDFLRSEPYSKIEPAHVVWSCINEKCVEHGRIFRQQLPQVSLTEVQQ